MSKVWLITGCSRGFGRALAEAVLEQGDKLIATARKPEQISDLVDRYGEQVRAVVLDVTNTVQVESAIQASIDAFGRLDVVVNNAGYGNIASIEETTDEDWKSQIETNLWGVINVTRAALPILRKQKEGYIVQFSSIGGRTGSPGLGPYQTAKWAVEGFSEVLSKEVAPLGIKVILIEPGGFRTDWAGSSMKFTQPNEDYQDTVGEMYKRLSERAGKEAGDPVRAAKAVITIVNEENPPLRLLLGRGAVQIARATDQAKLAETDRWEALSISADFEE
ncbi:short-chain dehydrogenase/reductase [Paenibacillus ferrarius]|uniref:Short-chain dehydrogenase/reductase n=1 Tax=Paenibacillus ferrarius TaxID=1469647 RepID=A0A1V4HD80_9BACL|nr:oxidoreductase [Paenibacillus ferrarius]OPH51859.1 short-chain dehydrogenase/reductase [Paenibacillus ferrarius]